MNFSPSVKLNSGYEIPVVGLGTFLSQNEEILKELIVKAIELGYRHFDTAILYGNQKFLGPIFKEIISSGKVTREELFITTKVFPFKQNDTVEQLKEALQELQMDYVDLYLLHWPLTPPENPFAPSNLPVHVAWEKMEECVNQGLTRSIGVSNYNVQSLFNLCSFAKIRPAVNQYEMHVYLQQPDLLYVNQQLGIHVTAYSCLARGGEDVQKQLGEKIDLFNDEVLMKIAANHQKTVAQVALNYLLGQGVSVIPKTENLRRLGENFACFDFELTQEEKKQIQQLDKNLRTIQPKLIAGGERWSKVNPFA